MGKHKYILRYSRLGGRGLLAGAASARRGLILLVVLVMVVLLTLLAASFSFLVNAHLSAVMSEHDRFQARMAAESGVQRAIAVLRVAKNDPSAWHNNPEQFRASMVYGPNKQGPFERQNETGTYDPHAPAAWRFELVAPNPDDPTTVRYGVTDECSKLDLNRATEAQLHRLFDMVIPKDTQQPVDVNILVDSLMDWREAGTNARPNGAKDAYYQSLSPSYKCKGAPFSTIEELLLVRGFSAWVVFGEDYNRNGLLDPNEDDGDASFPPDDGDGRLFAGVAPFFTIWSQELNVSNDGRPRINLNMKDTQKLQDLLSQEFSGAIGDYILKIRAGGMAFNSVMNLLPAPPPPPKEEGEEEQKPPGKKQPTSGPASSQPTSQEAGDQNAGLQDHSSDQGQATTEPSEKKPKAPRPVFKNLTEEMPPGTPDDLPLILDRLTVQPVPAFTGRINPSTATREVLSTFEEVADDQLGAIVAARSGLKGDELSTPAWLLRSGAIDEQTFREILDRLATKSSAFRVESVGYGDHVGVIERINVVLEMRGPIAQTLYYRNLTPLGPSYNPFTEETRGAHKRPS